MKSIILAALVGLLHAEVVVKHLTIQEGGTQYTQTVTLDYERNIQILEVPAHNNIVHSKTIFDFNQGMIFESHPETNTCYMKDIPEGVVSMDKFADFLDKQTGPVTASAVHTTRRTYKTTAKVTQHQLSSMAQEVVAECGKSTVYQVKPVAEEELEISYRRAPKSLAEVFMMGSEEECHMQDNCLWQTCQVGTDSCWWTVNCETNEDHCDETLDHSQIMHDCAGAANDECQISCKPCFNLQCPGCEYSWDNGCRPGFEAQGVPACPADPALGEGCGLVYCPMYPDVAGGEWDCLADDTGAAMIEEGHSCLLWCAPGVMGGAITCTHDSTWEEAGPIGC